MRYLILRRKLIMKKNKIVILSLFLALLTSCGEKGSSSVTTSLESNTSTSKEETTSEESSLPSSDTSSSSEDTSTSDLPTLSYNEVMGVFALNSLLAKTPTYFTLLKEGKTGGNSKYSEEETIYNLPNSTLLDQGEKNVMTLKDDGSVNNTLTSTYRQLSQRLTLNNTNYFYVMKETSINETSNKNVQDYKVVDSTDEDSTTLSEAEIISLYTPFQGGYKDVATLYMGFQIFSFDTSKLVFEVSTTDNITLYRAHIVEEREEEISGIKATVKEDGYLSFYVNKISKNMTSLAFEGTVKASVMALDISSMSYKIVENCFYETIPSEITSLNNDVLSYCLSSYTKVSAFNGISEISLDSIPENTPIFFKAVDPTPSSAVNTTLKVSKVETLSSSGESSESEDTNLAFIFKEGKYKVTLLSSLNYNGPEAKTFTITVVA